ncbi:MAG: hypothetical protein M1835_005581 [Candelina submexicana]|nr:MAG: hypothetical protein M1835_005581 [Candelina submexicana]
MPTRHQPQRGSYGPRPASSTSNSASGRRRPKSRASTASTKSTSTQPSRQHESDAPFDFQQHHQQPQQEQDAFQYSPENMIMRSAQQLTNPNDLVIDPALEDPNAHVMSFPSQNGSGNHPGLEQLPAGDFSAFAHPSNHDFDVDNDMQAQATPEPGEKDVKEAPKKKGSNSSIANDLELRRLHREHQHMSVTEAAVMVLQNERTQMAEKSKQVFAMLWLTGQCRRSTGSVPRNRVFSHYATRCGTERVPTLNPASFGKLVRIIFPGISTRRLGVRGESKYHYVNLSLDEDHPDIIHAERARKAPGASQKSENLISSSRPPMHVDTAVFPSTSVDFPSLDFSHWSTPPNTMFLDTGIADPNQAVSKANMIERKLKFPSSTEVVFKQNEHIELPDITKHLPPGTDADNAAALTALYRSHCTSLIDCIRFCKEKSFFHHFTSFHGTLTVPVQKLLANPKLAPWIHECDWLMYQKMIRVVAPLTGQVVPRPVLQTLKVIAETLTLHVAKTFKNHPSHVIEAKIGPATLFARLLGRLIRVNAASHAAANMLCNDANRDQMWEDWIRLVNPLRVMEGAVPECGYEKVLNMLTVEIRRLLEPISTSSYMEMGTLFETALLSSNHKHQHGHVSNGTSTEGVLDRWTDFFTTLPSHFPHVDAQTIITSMSVISSTALRDITIAQGQSFGSWWISKIWIDEMMLWLAEKGGFMDYSSSAIQDAEAAFAADVTEGFSADPRSRASSHGSHLSNAKADYSTVSTYRPNGVGVSHRGVSMDAASQAALATAVGFSNDQGHDDSGIGMPISEEDINNLEKYNGFVTEAIDGAQAESDGVGSDVVVC